MRVKERCKACGRELTGRAAYTGYQNSRKKLHGICSFCYAKQEKARKVKATA